MYNVIVVDDEKIIRNGIKNYINGRRSDYHVIGDFADGKDAYLYLNEINENESEKVDVVITDIKMVDMSGLELSKWINENMKDVLVIILSGYKDFDYAKEAIRFNVKNYLLKPIEPSELMETLDALKKKLDNKRSQEKMSLSNIKHLYALIADEKGEEAHLYFNTIMNELKFEPLEMIKESVTELFSVIVNKLNIYFEIQINIYDFQINSIIQMNDPAEIQKFGIKTIDMLISKMSSKNLKSDEHIMLQAKKFIEENYKNDISLQDVSDRLFFSPSYFSRFFKRYTGENFSDYLLKLRMTKAVEFLKRGKKVEETAQLCGYNSASYFSHIFKEYYNYTPKEYIRRF